MDISRLSKAQVLATLHGASHQQGLGALQPDQPLTVEEAQDLLDKGQTYFDYLRGRVMKIDLSTNELDTMLYNRDNGQGAAETALVSLFAEVD